MPCWRRPSFPKESAELLAEAHNEVCEGEADEGATGPGPDGAYAWHDPVTNAYHFHVPEGDYTDVYVCVPIDGVDHWRIGADALCWEASPVTRITVTFEVAGVDARYAQERIDGALDNGEVQNLLDPDGEWTFTQAHCTTEAL